MTMTGGCKACFRAMVMERMDEMRKKKKVKKVGGSLSMKSNGRGRGDLQVRGLPSIYILEDQKQ